MRTFITVLGLTLLMFSGVYIITAQQPSRSDLEKRRSSIMNEIAATQQQLAETRQERNASMSQLRALQAKLNAREKLIGNINQEMGHINNSIVSSGEEIKELNKNLDVLKARYAQSIRYAYKTQKSQNLLAFLFSADDFNDAMRRFQYMKKNRDFRKNQAGQIHNTQGQLQKQISILGSEKHKKGELLHVEEDQKAQIQEETQLTNQMVEELKGKEGDLNEKIARSKVAAKRMDAAIKSEIQREIEIARKKAMEEAQRKAAAEAAQRKAAEEIARKKADEEKRVKEAADRDKALADARARRDEATNSRPVNGPASDKPLNPTKPATTTIGSNTGNAAASTKPAATKPAESKAVAAAAPKNEPIKPAAAPPKSTTPAAKPAEAKPVVVAAEKPSYKLSLTPDVQALSNNFAANHGRLPWPVEKGYIALPFGNYKHPLEPKVTMNNSGIDIAAGEGAGVRCVFEGTVMRVVNIAGAYTVIVNHGEYFSVYSYLRSASVKQGDKVGFKQAIGTIGKNDDGENMLHFEICKVNANNSISNVNPAEWIAR